MAPFTNVVTSALDVASDLHKGEYGTAAGDALGLVPGFKLAKSALRPSMIARAAEKVSQYRQPIDAAVNVVPEFLGKLQPPAAPAALQPSTGAITKPAGFADGGLIQGPGTGTSDSVAAVANGQRVAVNNGEFRVPAAVVQALGRDFFDELVWNYHQPTGKPNGPMPTSEAPLGYLFGQR